jgi:class 3 adenylate cyclase
VAARALTWAYGRLGRLYPRIFLAAELLTAFPIILFTYGLFSFYYRGTTGDFFALFGFSCALAAIAIAVTWVRTAPLLRPVERWIAGERDERATSEAWAAAVSFPWRMVRSISWMPVVVVVIPSAVLAVLWLGLSWLALIPLTAGAVIALGYVLILHTLALELGLRPVLVDIGRHSAPRTHRAVRTLPLRWRLLLTLPAINVITGVVVAALTSEGGGAAGLGLDVAVAVGVATTVTLGLTVLLSRSITRPLGDLQRATERVRAGDYTVSVPVTTGDEVGELAASFNQLVEGLAERERIRDALGTYLDRTVADYILSESYDEQGMEVEVSVLFCDVRGFTEFAARSDARTVVARLNRLFEVIVPVIDRHGGHVDKFVGDGLLAVFGAPRRYPDHAVRATKAAIEIVRLVNEEGRAGELRVCAGVNTGPVVAGAIGGGGRLNFSVIGDAVNVAARVEAATRQLDADVLLTAATAEQLGELIPVRRCGEVEIRGLEEPVQLYVPAEIPGRRDGNGGWRRLLQLPRLPRGRAAAGGSGSA